MAGLTRDKVIGSRPDIGLAHAYMSLSISLSLSFHSRVSPSIFNTCSIMRVLAQIEGWSRLMMKIRVQLLHAHLSCYPSIYMCLFVFRLGSLVTSRRRGTIFSSYLFEKIFGKEYY